MAENALSGDIQLTLPCQVVHATAAGVLQQLQQAWAEKAQALPAGGKASRVTVNADALQEFDSSALAVLLALARNVQQQAGQFAITHTTPRLQALAQAYGVRELLAPQAHGGEFARN